jgi:hypothetical protein
MAWIGSVSRIHWVKIRLNALLAGVYLELQTPFRTLL